MELKKIIREELNDFGWTEPIGDGLNMNVEHDYMGVWPDFEKMFSDLGVPWLEGTVTSSDYDGEAMLEIRSEHFMIDVTLSMRFDEDRGDSLITYSIYDPDEYETTLGGGEYWPPRPWLGPILGDLRGIVTRLIKK